MKKTFAILTILLSMSFYSFAQVNPHAIGVRFGNAAASAFGMEVSFQQGIGDANRLELDLGSNFGANDGHDYTHSILSGIYQWDWNIVEGLNWYIGPGAEIGGYVDYDKASNNCLTLAVGGQVGLEYDFNTLDVPILVSLDARPMLNFINYNSALDWGLFPHLSVRYTW